MASELTAAPAPVMATEGGGHATGQVSNAGKPGGPERWEMGDTVYVNAPVDKVWEEMVDFTDIGRWHPRVLSSTLTAGQAQMPGAVRCVQTHGGHTFYEMLTKLDTEKHAVQYTMLDNTFGLVDYHAQIALRAGNTPDSTAVSWSSIMGVSPVRSKDEVYTLLGGSLVRCGEKLNQMLSPSVPIIPILPIAEPSACV